MPRSIEQHLKRERMNPADWISVQEAARRLGFSDSQMWTALACGPLYSKKVGSRRVVYTASVTRLMAQHQENSSAKGAAHHAMSDAERRISRIQSILDSAAQDAQPITITTHHSPLTTHQNHGLQIERKIWIDRGRDDYWIPTARAAEILNVTERSVCALARRGKLQRRWADVKTNEPVDRKIFRGRSRAMFSLREVQSRADCRTRQHEGITYSPKDPERPLRPSNYRQGPSAPGDALITTSEAAYLLGVSRRRISDLVWEGRLFAWQKEPRKHGSRIYLSANQVHRYGSKPERLARRERDKQGKAPGHTKPPFKPNMFQENYRLWAEPQKALNQHHGEFYTTRQAAHVLGVSLSTVRDMRDRGRLKAYRSPSSGDNRRIFNRRRHWFYKKDEVDALLNNPEYQRKRKAYWKSRMPWAYGQEAVATPPNEDEWYPHQFDHSPSPAAKMKMEMENW